MGKKNPTVGMLRHHVSLYSRTETPTGGSSGFQTDETFTLIGMAWTALFPLSELRKLDQKQIGAPVTHKALMRYREDITINDRIWIEYDSRRFDVKGFSVIGERQRFYELLLEEVEPV